MRRQLRGVWCAAGLLAAVFAAPPAMAQQKARLTTGAAKFAMHTPSAAGCPDQGGLLDSISVPVNQSIALSVQIPAPLDHDVSFQLRSANPNYVAAGDKVQGFLPIVTVPAGQVVSNAFNLFGVSVGSTSLYLIPLSPRFGAGSFPTGAWDVNKSGGSSSKFVDANAPSTTCRDPGSPAVSINASVLANCGTTAAGVASDGVTQLLMRTLSGLPGTACYEVVSTSGLDQGSVATPVTGTQPVGGLNYAFSLYRAPANYGDASDSRTVTVKFTFTPDIGNANTTSFTADLKVLRPPVVLMHGLWSKPSAWDSSFVRNDASHTTVAGNYQATNASHFSANVPRVKEALDNALAQFRSSQNAATQVDVIGHSMGGILTRLYANSAQNTRIDNYNLGDVHRLITLDTPHWGSTLANLLISLRQVAPARVDFIGDVIGSVKQGAVCDLAENSPALQGLGATAVPGSAITATGGTFPAYRTAIENALTANVCTSWSLTLPPHCTGHAYLFPQNRVNGFRFQQANDQIVGLTDQQGGLGGANFAALVHTNVNGTPGVATTAFGLLDGPASALAGAGFPAAQSNGLGNPAAPPRGVPGLGAAADQADYAAQCGAGGPMNPGSITTAAAAGPRGAARRPAARTPAAAVSPLVVITSPPAGQRYAPGDTLTVDVQVAPSLGATDVVLGMPPLPLSATTRLDASTYRASQTLPADYAGALTITPVALDAQQNEIRGAPVTVTIAPAVSPVQVAFAQRYYYLAPSAGSQQLDFSGTFGTGGPRIDLTSSVSGTTYASSNPAVATVSADGEVSVQGNGIAVVTGRNAAATDWAVFVIEDAAAALPPLNVGTSFTIQRGGFRLDRNTGFFVQSMVVTNSSSLPIPGGVWLVLSGLPGGVSLVNKSGLTATALAGSPFVALPLSPDGRTLAPGQSATLYLQFLNPNRVGINYSTSVYRSSTTP